MLGVPPKSAAPYIPFAALEKALIQLDRRSVVVVAESVWSADPQLHLQRFRICAALRFLNLIDDGGRLTKIGRAAVSPLTRKQALDHCVREAYSDELNEGLARFSLDDVRGTFEKSGMSEDTAQKAATFFLRVAQYAGRTLHRSVRLRHRDSAARSSRSWTRTKAEPLLDGIPLSSLQLEAGGRVTLLLTGQVPAQYSKEERDTLHQVMGLLGELSPQPRPPSRVIDRKTDAA